MNHSTHTCTVHVVSECFELEGRLVCLVVEGRSEIDENGHLTMTITQERIFGLDA